MYLFDQHAGARFEQVAALEGRLAEEELVGEHPEGPEVDARSVPKGGEMERTRGEGGVPVGVVEEKDEKGGEMRGRKEEES